MTAAEMVRRRLLITGVVQGVGFRPFVWRRAVRLGLTGWVENDAAGVVVEIQGEAAAIAAFLDGLAAAAPPLAAVGRIDVGERPPEPGTEAFAIRSATAGGRATVHAPPDIAPCAACLAELADPGNRRHAYPFVNCTDCGPRFTIIEELPYDRSRTTMRGFTMCQRCAREYGDPGDRRFHAEPVACPDCGPTAWYAAVADGPIPLTRPAAPAPIGPAAIAAARAEILRGGIVALKGVGGFQIACDATNDDAVTRLRDRKARVGKPFAVMVADAATAGGIATVGGRERRLLESRERPIVILRRATDRGAGGPRLAAGVAPGLDVVGVMLPASPLHELLAAGLPPLVMTSGNLAEEPIAFADTDAVTRLAPLVDAFLLHDRPIHVPCDDSVIRCVAGMPLPIRRGRGFAPLPIPLADGGPAVLAVGGELKAAIGVVRGDVAIIGQHVGDVTSPETLAALDRIATHLLGLLDVDPEAIVADLHPGYLSAHWAARFAADRGIPLLRVQHHDAHVASLLAEHGRSVATPPPGFIGVCFDGTGYGRDGTIQGGEFLVATDGALCRAAHLETFPLPGGDAAVRHPWRTALAVLRAAAIEWDDDLPPVAAVPPAARDLLRRQLDRGLACPATSSMGRLFDAVAALVGLTPSISYEAEAALRLESLAAAGRPEFRIAPYAVASRETVGPLVVRWRDPVASVVAAVRAAVPAAEIAAGFHAATAMMIADTCVRLRGRGGVVGLTGGVFQNALLVAEARAALQAAGFEVLTHQAVPPNDGGLALGQAVLGRIRLARG